ncbi:MAG: phage portal protein [bacterium]|nr:phage portal protein [bacterium]
MGIFKNLFRSRDKPELTKPSTPRFFFAPTSSGKQVTEKTAMQSAAVYACVRVIAETIASLPLHLYRYVDEGKKRDPSHPLYTLLHNAPNPEMTSFIFRETLMTHLLLWGNAYAQILRNGHGEIVGIYPLLPDRMQVARDEDKNLIYLYQSGMKQIAFRQEEILHIPGLGFDGLVGYSPIAMARNAIGMAMATEEFGSSFFSNGAAPGGILEHPGTLKDPSKVRESWEELFKGSGNANRVAVLEEGMTYKQIGIPPNEAQFLETRKYQTEEICRIYRVPPHLVADLDKATFSNIEHQSISFVVHTIRPWLVRLEQAMDKALLYPEEQTRYFVEFNVDGLLRGDYESRMQGYATARQNGWMSANDIRRLENMNLIPDEEGGNLYLINGNMTKLKDAGLFAGQEVKESEE